MKIKIEMEARSLLVMNKLLFVINERIEKGETEGEESSEGWMYKFKIKERKNA